MTCLIAYLLSSMGLTILIVWPDSGPSAWLRERCLRPLLPSAAKSVLDCYLCLGFWVGLATSWPWWRITGEVWAWSGCLMTPCAFWLVLYGPAWPHGGSSAESPARQVASEPNIPAGEAAARAPAPQ